jgi:hypothetical protein
MFKRKALRHWQAPMPAKAWDRSRCSASRQLTLSTPFSLMIGLAALFPCTQTSSVAGVSLTAQTAEQVTPARPAEPSVAITETVVANCANAPRNCSAETDVDPQRAVEGRSIRAPSSIGQILGGGGQRPASG